MKKNAFTLSEVFYPVSKSKRVAFTLAEVLITLGIIGVVAAITMPTLIANHKKKEYSARLKKFYSAMSQAIVRSELDNGPVKYWEKTGQQYDADHKKIPQDNRLAALAFFNKYLEPYLAYTKIDENPVELQDEDGQAECIRVYFPDGTYMDVRNGACTDFSFNVKGKKQADTFGANMFKFILCVGTDSSGENRALEECGKDKYWCPYYGAHITPYTRQQALEQCKNRKRCAPLIMMDGWEFKKDYPW